MKRLAILFVLVVGCAAEQESIERYNQRLADLDAEILRVRIEHKVPGEGYEQIRREVTWLFGKDNPIFFREILLNRLNKSYPPPPPTATIHILSEPPGARIEVNDDFMGRTPCDLEIPTDTKGRFLYDTRIRALPIYAGQYTQTKSFRRGNEVLDTGDRVPKTILFVLGLTPVPRQYEIDVVP